MEVFFRLRGLGVRIGVGFFSSVGRLIYFLFFIFHFSGESFSNKEVWDMLSFTGIHQRYVFRRTNNILYVIIYFCYSLFSVILLLGSTLGVLSDKCLVVYITRFSP